jgi:hypothetical protein
MPSIVPGYVYSLFAALIVGTMIVFSCSILASNVKYQAETQQLENVEKYVATMSLNLIADSIGNNVNSTQFLELPSAIGTQQYWIRIANDSQRAWVEAGFGTQANTSQSKMFIPAVVSASGEFVSSSGRAYLNCYVENQTSVLKLMEE